jgi:hypothetical protein
LKLDSNEFYVLSSGNDLDIFGTVREAVDELKLSSSDDAEILRFMLDKSGKWTISQVSWKDIGKMLLRGSNDETGT